MSRHPDQPDYSVPSLGPISKESRLEWRSLMWNDGDIEDGETPEHFLTGSPLRGKFFPRGCRGKIERIEIYCMATAGGTLELSISPHPGMGQTYTVTITPGVAWAWQSVDLRQFWNYDSLFIWLSACEWDASYAYDEVAPHDAHRTLVTPVEWWRQNRRYFIRVVYDAETAGDVPVSGTINNIEIPSVAATRRWIELKPDADKTLYDTTQLGAGKLLYCIYIVTDDAARDALCPRMRVDGDRILPLDVDFAGWNEWVKTGSPKIAIGNYDTTAHSYSLVVAVDIPFKRSIEVGFYNEGAAEQTGYVGYIIQRVA